MSNLSNSGTDLRDLLRTLSPHARDSLRRVLVHDQADRDAIASELMATATSEARTGPTSSTSGRSILRCGGRSSGCSRRSTLVDEMWVPLFVLGAVLIFLLASSVSSGPIESRHGVSGDSMSRAQPPTS